MVDALVHLRDLREARGQTLPDEASIFYRKKSDRWVPIHGKAAIKWQDAPPGPPGPPGEQGPPGERGPQGKAGKRGERCGWPWG